jgi:Pro-kumamolisin, activation domain
MCAASNDSEEPMKTKISMTRRCGLSTMFSGMLLAIGLSGVAPALAAPSTFTLPPALLAGYTRTFRLDTALKIHLSVELDPRDSKLDAIVYAMEDPGSTTHRSTMTEAQFAGRFGRDPADVAALVAWFGSHGATNVYASKNRLVVGGDFTVSQAEKALNTRYDLWENAGRTVVAPVGSIALPVSGVRAVRGAIKAYTPRLAQVQTPSPPTTLRGQWFSAARFRQAYDAIEGGGAGMRIALIEDSSDRMQLSDLTQFARGDQETLAPLGPGSDAPRGGGRPGPGSRQAPEPPPPPPMLLDTSHVSEKSITPANNEQVCGRDDRGQEPTMDVDAALTMAPLASIEVRYDEVCLRGGEGTLELQRALDEEPAPDVVVFPFAVAPLYDRLEATFGPTPIVYLEAALRGIPIVVPSGDDGAYGIRVIGMNRPAVVYPCVLSLVICAGGTSLGERLGQYDEGPWNDGTHASGGGISLEPRPRWQTAPMDFALAHDVENRMVPDVSADAAGHLYVFWHGYGEGGVGGTSESAAIVGAQLAAIDAPLPKEKRLLSSGDLYALARAHPEAFRDVVDANDRGYVDNTLHPRNLAPPLGFVGVVPSPPPTIKGCVNVRPNGCDVAPQYDLVTGIGSLKEATALKALQSP